MTRLRRWQNSSRRRKLRLAGADGGFAQATGAACVWYTIAGLGCDAAEERVSAECLYGVVCLAVEASRRRWIVEADVCCRSLVAR
ncbi:hypothetical protein K491DRAFT_518422 [Lophiostoma macrostomum CBS 122681]|uniref:Uncharacterized protein n=1 Tax=Lophiostoma macrostomum CBS 122681 TaxID=1314788 RepID=A0A6A6T094_9PLEO|nr:hypothetical protein K491DRAFT_518422 [Lophiostoma macrostomum CBS 122681]